MTKLLVRGRRQGKTTELADWIGDDGVMICHTVRNAKDVEDRFGVEAIGSNLFYSLRGSKHKRIGIDNLWLLDRPKAIIEEAEVCAKEVACTSSPRFEIVESLSGEER